jgi:hypothetical protein
LIKVFSLQDEAKKAELQKKFNEEVLPGLLKNIGNYLIKINSLLFWQLKIFCKDDICIRRFLFFYAATTAYLLFHHEIFFDYTFGRREEP